MLLEKFLEDPVDGLFSLVGHPEFFREGSPEAYQQEWWASNPTAATGDRRPPISDRIRDREH
jgi:hypothetical protein